MCGICLAFVQTSELVNSEDHCSMQFSCQEWLDQIGLMAPLRRRGPDSLGLHDHTVDEGRSLHCVATVLHVRGTGEVTSQPVVDETDDTGSFLLFNGEIYEGLPLMTAETNDTRVLFHRLMEVSNSSEEFHMVSLFSELEGPFAIIFFDGRHKRLWFGRDAFGRRSLLYGIPTVGHDRHQVKLVLSSVASCSSANSNIVWSELPAGFVFSLDLNHDGLTAYRLRPRSIDSSLDALRSTFNQCHLVDCTPAAWKGLFHMNRQPGTVYWDSQNDAVEDSLELWYLEHYEKELAGFLAELRNAIRKRMTFLSKHCHHCNWSSPSADCGHSKLALLFSGGVDSVLLAALLAEELEETGESVDLLNVAFGQTPSQAPDRVTGESAIAELRRLYPKQCCNWKFVKIDVDQQELSTWRNRRIAHLVRPLETVLDDSIGCVLWFAARGTGLVSGPERISYSCPNRVLFLGSGADELLAGYSRHRKRYFDFQTDQDRRTALIDELEMELRRIGSRNLARDDRVTADHGRETRLPYLDEHFVKYVNSLPLEAKVDMRHRRGVGDKLILRMALRKLGFQSAYYRLPKRAMQFGSRIAKAENRKEKGGDRCQRLVQGELEPMMPIHDIVRLEERIEAEKAAKIIMEHHMKIVLKLLGDEMDALKQDLDKPEVSEEERGMLTSICNQKQDALDAQEKVLLTARSSYNARLALLQWKLNNVRIGQNAASGKDQMPVAPKNSDAEAERSLIERIAAEKRAKATMETSMNASLQLLDTEMDQLTEDLDKVGEAQKERITKQLREKLAVSDKLEEALKQAMATYDSTLAHLQEELDNIRRRGLPQ